MSTVYGLVKNDAQAIRIANRLKNSGFSPNDISILSSDRGGVRDLGHENATKAPEGAVTGAAAGSILGGALGWLVGVGSLAIPGVGPLIAAGPILAALSGMALGGTAGGPPVNQSFQAQELGLLAPAECDILNLDLGPLDLDLLGLVVDLSPVDLDITGLTGEGKLLGNLLCAITGLLDPGDGGLLASLLAQLNELLGD